MAGVLVIRGHGQEGFVETLASSRARIDQLEREASERDGDTDEVLRVHLDRYRALILSIAELIWTLDAAGEMLGEQPSWTGYTAQTLAQHQGRGWLDAVHPDDRALSVETLRCALRDGAPWELEHRLRRHDGQYRWFSVRAVPVRDPDGAIREWAGIHTDITERKRTEQTLRDGERHFRELADSMPQIVWEADPGGRFDYYNRRWYEFTGRPEGITGDGSWADVVHPEDQAECLARWHSAVASGDAYEIEYRLREKGGTYHWFLRRAVPVRDPAGRVTRWFGTCTNIDGVKHTEEVLRRSSADAAAANHELEAFSYSVAHDLRTPLRSIDGFSLALLEDNAEQLDAQGRNSLARVRAAAQRMARLIDELLSLARVSRGELRTERVNLTAIVDSVVRRLRETDTGRDVEVVVAEGMVALGDPDLLTTVMENLLGNAWKFTSRMPKARIEISVTSRDGKSVYFVRDDGAGFDMAHAGKLFGAFQRLHPSTEFPGNGIGLATVQRIVGRHGGRIWAASETDRGATFFFTLGGNS